MIPTFLLLQKKGLKIVKCPNCGEDITEEMFSIDSDEPGFIDIGYECEKCGIEVYTFLVKPIKYYSEE